MKPKPKSIKDLAVKHVGFWRVSDFPYVDGTVVYSDPALNGRYRVVDKNLPFSLVLCCAVLPLRHGKRVLRRLSFLKLSRQEQLKSVDAAYLTELKTLAPWAIPARIKAQQFDLKIDAAQPRRVVAKT